MNVLILVDTDRSAFGIGFWMPDFVWTLLAWAPWAIDILLSLRRERWQRHGPSWAMN